MNQKWLTVVGVVVVLGLSLLLGDTFSGDRSPTSDSVAEPVSNAKPVTKEPERPKVETDFVTGVHLRGMTARTAMMTDSDGTELPGIEYMVELELPRRLEMYSANNRLEVRAAVSGETMNFLGTNQFHANVFQLRETNQQYLVYQVHLITYASHTFDTDKLDELATHVIEDLRISFYADGKKVKEL